MRVEEEDGHLKFWIPFEVKEDLWDKAKDIVRKKPYAEAGSRNNVNGRDRVIDTFEGLLSEYAVASHLGTEACTDAWYGHGDGNFDLEWNGLKIDIKASSLEYPSLLIRVDRPIVSDVYILCKISRNYNVEIVGGKLKKDVVGLKPRKVHKKGPMNLVVRYNDVTPFNKLFDMATV